MKNLIPFLLLTLIWSCGNTDWGSKIIDLEKKHNETPTTDVKRELLASYKSYLNDLKNDANAFSDISNKAATLQLDMNQYPDAIATLTESVKNYSGGTSQVANLSMLSNVLVNFAHTSNFQTAADEISKIYPDASQLKSTFSPIITNLAETMLDEKSGKWNRQKVREFIAMSRLQGAIVKNDDAAQKSLFDAANMAIAMKKYDQAMQIYDYVLTNPDNFSKVPTALFLKGFTYDEHLKNYDEAKKYYNEFLEKYPNDPYATSVKGSLQNLGKSAEEIIQSFGK